MKVLMSFFLCLSALAKVECESENLGNEQYTRYITLEFSDDFKTFDFLDMIQYPRRWPNPYFGRGELLYRHGFLDLKGHEGEHFGSFIYDRNVPFTPGKYDYGYQGQSLVLDCKFVQ